MNVTALRLHATISSLVMISKFGFSDFKGHRDTWLALGRLTMLVGDNASGKTSVLDALALQARILHDPIAVLRANGDLKDVARRGSTGGVVLRSWWNRPAQEIGHLKLDLRTSPAATHASEQNERELVLTGEIDGRRVDAFMYQRRNGEFYTQNWQPPVDLFDTAAIYRLRAEAVSAAAYSDQPEVEIGSDGSNTAVALSTMKLGDDEAFQRVEDGLRLLVPSVERVRIRRAKVYHPPLQAEVLGGKIYFDFRGAPDVPGQLASQGTLIVLALLTILHRAQRPNLILLDDFDHALHPRAQIELVRMFKKLLELERFQDVQVVATTHSPYVLDEIDPSAIYAFALRDDGTVASKRLSEHPEAERTRGTLKAGQLWSLDPERDWVLQD